MSDTTAPALVLFAHGARDPRWAEPFQRIQSMLRARRSDAVVELAFLELMQPVLADAIATLVAKGHRRITIAPLFMAQGGHLKQDLPKKIAALRERHPEIDIVVSPPIGEVEAILDVIAAWALGESHG